MKPYSLHGGDIYGFQQPVLDFSININPLGMPEGAVRAAEEGIRLSGRYPDWRKRELTAAIRRFHHLTENEGQIICGNGVAELLYALCFYLRGKGAQTFWTFLPTFMEYESAAGAAGLKRAVREDTADVIFICNPNNPTGTLYARDRLRTCFEDCRQRHAVLVTDESFLPFLEEDGEISLLHDAVREPGLFVLRSLTKIYAMPGLRLGYLVCGDEKEAEGIQSFLQPWNVSIPAQMAGVASLEDEDYLKRTRIYVKRERAKMAGELSEILRTGADGRADFLFFHADEDLGKRLLQRNILIRDCSDIRGLSKGWYRVGLRSPEDNQRLIAALAECRSTNP